MRAPESVLSKKFRCPNCGKKLRFASLPKEDKPDPFVGKEFAHYEVQEKVGEGAMASVYRARNVRLDKTVALKILSDQATMGPMDISERFLAEARSAASLDHSNVLTIYYAGKEEEHLFIEMQYADGGTVREALSEKGRFGVRDAARIVRDASRGLAAAHKKHIIHRDVKLQNLMLMRDGTVKVADFGLAKVQDGQKDLTVAGFVLGTPLYMSPEQVAGKAVDERSDIYSLGICFFEMLTGHVPFDAPTPAAVLHKHVYEEMPSPLKYVPDVPESVCSIIAKMTRKKPERRYATCDEIIKDLDNFLAGSTEISALEVEAEESTDVGISIEVDNLSIFQTMARYAFASGGGETEVIQDLRGKAKNLNIPPGKAETIIADVIKRHRAQVEAAPQPTPVREIGADLQKEAARRRRRQQAEATLAIFLKAFLLIAIAAVVVGTAYGVRSFVLKRRETAHLREQQEEKQQRVSSAERLAREGEKLEAAARWQEAVDQYRASLDLHEDDAVRARLAVALRTIEAIHLDAQEKWDEAEAAYKSLIAETRARDHIAKRIERVKNIKLYYNTYAIAKDAYAKEDWQRASEEFRRAAELAQSLGLKTDAVSLAENAQGQMDTEKDRQARMNRLLDTCQTKQNAYAALAASEYYLALPEYEGHRAKLTDFLDRSKTAIQSIKEEGPKSPLPETNDLRVVKLKKGEVLYGKLREKRQGAVEIEPLEGESKDVRRLLPTDDIGSMEPIAAKDINEMRAEMVFADLVAAWKGRRPFEVLTLLGKLTSKFADTRIVGDADLQKKKFDATLADLLEKTVRECEGMCTECAGTGFILCDACGGDGKLTLPCDACRNPHLLPKCDKCLGLGLQLTARCDECKGRGKLTCDRCKGKGCPFCGMQGKWDCRPCGGTGKVPTKRKCPTCNGACLIGGKPCPKCYGRGKPACHACKGTGRQTCVKCNGTQEIQVPCTKCKEKGQVQCTRCQGTGKR
ncbi:MAG: protein kinase [Planctomycetota bacterium]